MARKLIPLLKLMRSATSFGVVLMAVAVFLGALDWTPASEAHLLVDVAGDQFCAPSAIHPCQALHVERSTAVKRSWSPVRIHHVRVKSAKLAASLFLAPPTLRSLLPEAPDLAAIGTCLRPSGARAPPFA